jgi:hypothetical protein
MVQETNREGKSLSHHVDFMEMRRNIAALARPTSAVPTE